MRQQLVTHLRVLYSDSQAEELARRIEERLSRTGKRDGRAEAWCADDVLMITYADSISNEGERPLQSMRTFLSDTLSGLVSHVHLLPFFPYTSDDGFAVVDYRQVDPASGEWEDINALSEDVELIFDLVINHASASNPHFQEFLEDRAPGNQYFFTAGEDEDVSEVTRPRASPLLQKYETAGGPRWVWCSFSRDQVDWDFSNPEVLFEFVDIFLTYIEHGASWVRLDAIAFLWKQLGTACIHLPQTHAAVKLLRVLAEEVSSDVKILTETNVPLRENLSYFGDGDEAHIVYNFSLPPLLVHGLLNGDATHLTAWCNGLPILPQGCTYLNFTASHDGVGLRPIEGILDSAEVNSLLDCIREFGGKITERRRPDGTLSPYEANIALFDAFAGTIEKGLDGWQVERFLASQAVMMCLAGVPALYYNSFLASSNNVEGFLETGRNRTLNRKKWTLKEIDGRLKDELSAPVKVLAGLKDLLRVRKVQPGFHPEVSQEALLADSRLFVLKRAAPGQTLVCATNLSADSVSLERSLLSGAMTSNWEVIYQSGSVEESEEEIVLSPYAILWLSSSSL